MHHADVYLLIVAASIPFLALYNAGAAIFRTMGNSKVTMQISIIMNIINIGGNAILIYGFHRGTEGVAIPTLVSRITAAVIIIVMLCDEKRILHIERTWHYRINWEMVKKILSIGVPNGLENSMFQLGKIIVLSLVSTFGTYAIAANAVSNAIALFQILPGMAVTLAITPVISRCVGAGDYEQAGYYNKKLMVITYVSMTAMVLFIFSLLPVILKAYNLSDLTARTTADIIHFHGSVRSSSGRLHSVCLRHSVRREMRKRVCIFQVYPCGYSGSDSVTCSGNIWAWVYLVSGLRWSLTGYSVRSAL